MGAPFHRETFILTALQLHFQWASVATKQAVHVCHSNAAQNTGGEQSPKQANSDDEFMIPVPLWLPCEVISLIKKFEMKAF